MLQKKNRDTNMQNNCWYSAATYWLPNTPKQIRFNKKISVRKYYGTTPRASIQHFILQWYKYYVTVIILAWMCLYTLSVCWLLLPHMVMAKCTATYNDYSTIKVSFYIFPTIALKDQVSAHGYSCEYLVYLEAMFSRSYSSTVFFQLIFLIKKYKHY